MVPVRAVSVAIMVYRSHSEWRELATDMSVMRPEWKEEEIIGNRWKELDYDDSLPPNPLLRSVTRRSERKERWPRAESVRGWVGNATLLSLSPSFPISHSLRSLSIERSE